MRSCGKQLHSTPREVCGAEALVRAPLADACDGLGSRRRRRMSQVGCQHNWRVPTSDSNPHRSALRRSTSSQRGGGAGPHKRLHAHEPLQPTALVLEGDGPLRGDNGLRDAARKHHGNLARSARITNTRHKANAHRLLAIAEPHGETIGTRRSAASERQHTIPLHNRTA